jgi:ribonuclease HI
VIRVWTDGCCASEAHGGGGAGGWAFIGINAAGGVLARCSGAVPFADAGRMELLAVLEALRRFVGGYDELHVCTDSHYVTHGFKRLQSWHQASFRYTEARRRGQPVRDYDLWQSVYPLWRHAPLKLERVSRGIHALNVEADHAAKQAMRRQDGPRTVAEQRLMRALDGALRA